MYSTYCMHTTQNLQRPSEMFLGCLVAITYCNLQALIPWGGLNAPANDELQTDANSIIDNSSQSQRSASSRRQVGATSLGLLKLGDLDDLGYPYQHTPFRGYIGINIRGPSDTTHEKKTPAVWTGSIIGSAFKPSQIS